jgi:hypothetical protein
MRCEMISSALNADLPNSRAPVAGMRPANRRVRPVPLGETLA